MHCDVTIPYRIGVKATCYLLGAVHGNKSGTVQSTARLCFVPCGVLEPPTSTYLLHTINEYLCGCVRIVHSVDEALALCDVQCIRLIGCLVLPYVHWSGDYVVDICK